MTIKKELALKDFAFWGGAVDSARYLTDNEFDTLEELLEDVFPESANEDGIDEDTINNLFWFDYDFIAELLGYKDFEQIMERVIA